VLAITAMTTICINHEEKTSAGVMYSNVLRIHVLHVMKGSHASMMALYKSRPSWWKFLL